MQQKIDDVRPGGIQAEELEVERVREPGERMPVRRGVGGERPLHRVPLEAGLDVYVLGYVQVVIVVDEREMANRVIDRERGNGEEKSEKDRLPFRLRLWLWARR